jgi:hypothetical protein
VRRVSAAIGTLLGDWAPVNSPAPVSGIEPPLPRCPDHDAPIVSEPVGDGLPRGALAAEGEENAALGVGEG